jgi:hypothetical protein
MTEEEEEEKTYFLDNFGQKLRNIEEDNDVEYGNQF